MQQCQIRFLFFSLNNWNVINEYVNLFKASPGVGELRSLRLNNEEQIDMGSVTSGSYASAVEAQLVSKNSKKRHLTKFH